MNLKELYNRIFHKSEYIHDKLISYGFYFSKHKGYYFKKQNKWLSLDVVNFKLKEVKSILRNVFRIDL